MSFKDFHDIDNQRGYILIDVLMAIFIFVLGFSGLYALTSEGYANYQASMNLSEAAHLAQSKLALAENALKRGQFFEGMIEPGREVSGVEAGMAWNLQANWTEIPHLLDLRVVVTWQERDQSQTYESECLVYIDP